jgi:two-component system chemotaxis response regulator CheY
MFDSLKPHIQQLEHDKQYILKLWMDYDIVKETLEKHHFQVEYFADNFGIRVIDYALNVIKEKEELGDCPVIGVLLMLFKKKNIPLDDIFLICVYLKNALLHYLLEKNILTKDVLFEINNVMDYNFHGVIKEYIASYYKDCVKQSGNSSSTLVEGDEEDVKVISAKVYASQTEMISDLIIDLDELEDEVLNLLEDHQTFDIVLQMRSNALLNKYNSILNSLYEFRELSYMLTLLTKLLNELSLDIIEVEIKDNIIIYLKSIINDLQNWRKQVFIDQSAEDIHFMDQTLLSSAAQLKIMLMPEERQDSSEIDFF